MRKEIEVPPGYYWLHESMPRYLGEAIELIRRTAFRILEKCSHAPYYIAENLEPVFTNIKKFDLGELKIYIPEEIIKRR